jgi:hypothetical protein
MTDNDELSAKEIERRRDAAIAKMMATPPQPRITKKSPSVAKGKAKKKG